MYVYLFMFDLIIPIYVYLYLKHVMWALVVIVEVEFKRFTTAHAQLRHVLGKLCLFFE